MQQKGCIHIAHPQFISSNKSKTIQSIINTVKIYEGKSGVWRTAFHTVRKLKEIHPDITDIEIKPYIEVYFANKGLDYELYLIKIVEILDEDIDTNAPFYDVLERLQAGELDELPAGMLHTSDLSILATACRMLSEMDASGIFYLSSRKAGILIDKSHTHAAACLKKLQRQGLICLVKEYEKHQRKASEYRYGKHSETINFTQVTQVTQITQPTQGYTVKNPGISEKHRDDTIDLVGGDSTQFINHPSPKSGNLGTPEESIELSVDKLKDGVLGTLPKQELIPRIKSEQNSPLTDFPAVKEEGEVKCVICQKPTLYKNSSGSYVHPDDLVVRCPACKAKATQNIKPKKTPLREELNTCQNDCKRDGVTSIERNKKYAKLMCKSMNSQDNNSLKKVVGLIEQYGKTKVANIVYSILSDNSITSPIGVLIYRLKRDFPTS